MALALALAALHVQLESSFSRLLDRGLLARMTWDLSLGRLLVKELLCFSNMIGQPSEWNLGLGLAACLIWLTHSPYWLLPLLWPHNLFGYHGPVMARVRRLTTRLPRK